MSFRSIFNEISETIADKLTEDVTATHDLTEYTYESLRKYILSMKKEIPDIAKCTIAIEKRNKLDDRIFASEKYVIRMVMLDKEKNPIPFGEKEDEVVGTVIVADSIDIKLKEFMGDKTIKTVNIGGN